MDPKAFKKLLKKDKYQVFLFSCPVAFPVQIGFHYWFVINKKGKISRWEMLHKKKASEPSWGHLYLNLMAPTKGLRIFLFLKKFHWKSHLRGFVEGNNNSLAKKMADFIEKSPESYNYNYKFNLIFGPNSNTFIQYIINKFPESNLKLSWKAFGKNYKY